MKKLLTILLIIFLTFSVQAEILYKEAPLPHYSEAIGYGWQVTIPVSKPTDKNNILKTWENKTRIYMFLDENLDGDCNVVLVFKKMGKNALGQTLADPRPNPQNCKYTEKQIVNFIKKNSK